MWPGQDPQPSWKRGPDSATMPAPGTFTPSPSRSPTTDVNRRRCLARRTTFARYRESARTRLEPCRPLRTSDERRSSTPTSPGSSAEHFCQERTPRRQPVSEGSGSWRRHFYPVPDERPGRTTRPLWSLAPSSAPPALRAAVGVRSERFAARRNNKPGPSRRIGSRRLGLICSRRETTTWGHTFSKRSSCSRGS